MTDDDWREHAVCRGATTLFFPEPGDSRRGVAATKAVCAGCPVQQECLDYALDNQERFGIWGARTVREREAIIRARGGARRRALYAECGTDSGYYRHVRTPEPACDPCRRAHSVANTERLERARSVVA